MDPGSSVSTSLISGNEPRNTGLYNGIKPDPRLDSLANLPHGVLRKGGDFKVLLDPAEGLRGGQEGRPALDSPGEQDLRGGLKRQVMGREVVVAITKGKLDLGTWERIFYGEFDGRRRKRVLVKIVEE